MLNFWKKFNQKKAFGKKGVETLIAWVLLVGLGITLAALVTNWAIGNVKQFKPSESADIDLYCPDLSININSTCHIKNTGLFGVDKIIIQAGSTSKVTLSPRLLPGEVRQYWDTKDPNCNLGNGYIPVTINEEGRDVACSEKKVVL